MDDCFESRHDEKTKIQAQDMQPNLEHYTKK